MALLCVWSLLVFSACTDREQRAIVDELNDKAYYFHYRNVDSTLYYAERALEESDNYENGQAEALNNIAFYDIVKMDFGKADSVLNRVKNTTDNEVELFVADVQQMRICQRKSANKDYYVFQNSAQTRLKRIKESIEGSKIIRGNNRLMKRIAYAESEYYIVSSTYYYYVGLDEKSRDAIFSINADELIQIDSAQVADYLYNIGAGGIVTGASEEEVAQTESDCLYQCQYIARKCGYVFWQANALQSIAEKKIATDVDGAIEDAKRSLELFQQYGDVYQIAGAYRTLANCYWASGDYESSLENLKSALNYDVRIDYAPELVSSIHERLCVVYSALDNKPESDMNRNFYLDLQDGTRQDRYLESRADELGKSEKQLNYMLVGVLCGIVILVVLLLIFYKMKKRREDNFDINQLLAPLEAWSDNNRRELERLEEQYEETQEQSNLGRQKYVENTRKNVESRAKVSVVNSIVPFIDRMVREVNTDSPGKDLSYVAELTDKVNEYNSLLTEWIQMRQGELSLKIESFSLKPLFDIVCRAKVACQIKGVNLSVEDTEETVKADRTLTLFMLNTLVDNARKYTPKGGQINVSAKSEPDYVEISVADTGEGLTEEQLETIFNHKVSDVQQSHEEGKGFGFGLMNCKGIIEKYKKVSSLFKDVMIAAEGKKGEGCRFYFRLPKGKHFVVLLLMMLMPFANLSAQTPQQVKAYADSAYRKNVAGDYKAAIIYADSCSHSGTDDYESLLTAYNEAAIAALALHEWDVYNENNRNYIQLFKDLSTDTNLPTYCSDLQKSQTNKNIAIILLVILFLSIIPAYYILFYRHRMYYLICVDNIKEINTILLKDIQPQEKIESILPLVKDDFPEALRGVVERILQALRDSQANMETKQNFIELAEDECRRIDMENGNLHVTNNVLDNCLSTLKHETMYYPSRIRQLIDVKPEQSDDGGGRQLVEMVGYYKDLFTILNAQAMREVDKYKPMLGVVERFGQKFLGDKLLLDYLFELLAIDDENVSIEEASGQYIKLAVRKSDMELSDEECKQLFSPEGKNFKMLICRQIVRDHSQFTHRRGCGIYAQNNNGTEIIITLPKYGQV